LSKQIDNDVTHDHSLQQETKLKEYTHNAIETENEFESAASYLDGEMSENSINHYDSWISLNDRDSCTAKLRSSSKTLLPSEIFGVGANTNVNLFDAIFNKQYLFCKCQMFRHILSQIN